MSTKMQPGDWLYNVRRDGYDPTTPLAVPPFELEIEAEWPCLLAKRSTLWMHGGPASLRLATLVLDTVPAAERDHLRFTVRREVFTQGTFPPDTPRGWHTDYAHGIAAVSHRLRVHSYALVTADPCTLFLRPANIWLPNTTAGGFAFDRRMAELAPERFYVEPWTLVKFNATELHTATTWTGPNASPRLFFRATFDALRG